MENKLHNKGKQTSILQNRIDITNLKIKNLIFVTARLPG